VNNPPGINAPPGLHRGLGVVQATALNIANMVGIGPFITIPGFLAAMHGPQALIAWVIAAVLVLCDGLVWSELGAALPGSGGSYHFLSEIYGRMRFGRIVPFLFIWQFLVSGTLELASGYIAGVEYLKYPFPGLENALAEWHVPGGVNTLAAAGPLVVTLVLCRHIRSLGWLGIVFCVGTVVTMLTVIVAGYAHFNGALLTMPPDAFRIDGPRPFFSGLGAAMAIAIYDYLGYYNICHLGDEVVEPGRTIPRAVMLSVVVVAVLYLTMNLAIIGVVPWQDAIHSKFIASEFMELLYGRKTAELFTWLILWTVVASVFAMTLGYSRIPYVAAKTGGFFRVFAVVHPVHRYPVASLGALGLLTAVFCYFPLQDVISAAVTVRILIQFIGQIFGLHILRTTRPDVALPFRMWLYPIPSLVALLGWIFVFATSERTVLYIAVGVLVSGCVAYGVWTAYRRIAGISRHDLRDLLSGRELGPLATAARLILRVAALFYGLGARARNAAYDRGWKRIERASIPVVSLGNLTTGGTGKTPFAAFVARWFRERGVRVCFLSRGYRAGDGGINDEALVLDQLCPDVPHLQNPDRVAAARVAHEELDSQLLILDDGFQHRRLARDLDIVLIDATNPWGFGHLLPRGLLREPLLGLKRADVVVITRVDQASREEVEAIRRRVAQIHPECAIAEAAFPPARPINCAGATAALDSLAGQSVAAFCGIGNPAAFRATLENLGWRIADFRSFPDHHSYTRADVEDLERWSRGLAVSAVICTQKDLVKIGLERIGDHPLWAVEIGAHVTAGAELLEARLYDVLKKLS
jgi:tetraacyldisaccharide 4'-kinase